MNMKMNNFAVFILTYGRADKVFTYHNLRRGGYTGKIYLLCSTDDKQLQSYKDIYGEEVIVFSKEDYKNKFDIGDNFDKNNVVVFARNANFDIAKKLGLDYFLQLDDDYEIFEYKYPSKEKLIGRRIYCLDKIFASFINFLDKTNTTSIAFAQGGDFMGGKDSDFFNSINRKRKLMNCFFNSTKRPYQFYGRINEDVNCYIANGRTGTLFLTHPNISITQCATQSNTGGLTEFYLDGGTYVKSFYTLLFNPSAVSIRTMGKVGKRLHHSIKWINAVPVIIKQKYKKTEQ